MAKKQSTQMKSLAKLAMQRMKNGFWEECKEKINAMLK